MGYGLLRALQEGGCAWQQLDMWVYISVYSDIFYISTFSPGIGSAGQRMVLMMPRLWVHSLGELVHSSVGQGDPCGSLPAQNILSFWDLSKVGHDDLSNLTLI